MRAGFLLYLRDQNTDFTDVCCDYILTRRTSKKHDPPKFDFSMMPKTTKNNENNEKGGATKNRARRFLRYQMMIVAVCHRQPRAPLEGRRTPRGAAPLEGRRTPEGVAHP